MTPEVAAALRHIADKAMADPEIAYVAAKAAAMVEVYCETGCNLNASTIDAERWYELPVVSPNSGRTRKAGYTHVGYMDGVVEGEFRGRHGVFILDRKVTDQDISATSHYWTRLMLNHQLDEYALAYWQENGKPVEGIIYDVLRQPGIIPKTITLADLEEISEKGTYCDSTVQNKARAMAGDYLAEKARFAELKKQHAKDKKADPSIGEFSLETPEQPKESPHLYRLRCLQVLREKPEVYFQQQFRPKTESEIIAYAEELWTLSRLVHECQTLDSSPRNPGACFKFNTNCEYLGLCSGTESSDSPRWEQKEIKHPERLSHSRLTCFQECRRKHFFRYVAGIVPVERPTTERQTLGLLVQEALEVLWLNRPQTS